MSSDPTAPLRGPRVKRLATALLAAIALTLVSSAIKTTRMVQQDWDCSAAYGDCVRPMVAAGFPIAYITDYHGLSPGASADLVGALMGVDLFDWPRFTVTVLFYFIVVAAAHLLLHARTRHR